MRNDEADARAGWTQADSERVIGNSTQLNAMIATLGENNDAGTEQPAETAVAPAAEPAVVEPESAERRVRRPYFRSFDSDKAEDESEVEDG